MPGPNYFSSDQDSEKPDYFKNTNRPKKADWRSHERDVERRTGDRRTRGSGAGHGKTGQTRARRGVSPGDNVGKRLRECKATHGRGITIKGEWLEQLIEQALQMKRRPVLEIRLEGAKLPVPTDWVLVPAADYDDLEERAGD